MKFYERGAPSLDKPVVVAAMPDMGNVGGIVVDFINSCVKAKTFRVAKTSYPDYVIDKGGHIEVPQEEWAYRYADGLITFGGGAGQPRDGAEMHSMCQDVVDVARRYSSRLIYTVGGFSTRTPQDPPKTLLTATTSELAAQLRESGFVLNPRKSVIRGFNGLILGYAKTGGIRGVGLYGELNDPSIPQYRAAKSVIKTLEKLTYMKLGDTARLDAMAEYVERGGR